MNIEPQNQIQTSNTEQRRGITRWVIINFLIILVFIVILFIPAGRLNWLWGWLCILVIVANTVSLFLILIRSNPDLLVERAQKNEGEKQWDIPLAGIMGLFGPMLILLAAGLDVRFGWSPELPLWIHLLALGIMVLGSAITLWAMASNRFFSGNVRIQEERGHTVATGGPYQFVRHPGYSGALLFTLAMPFLLGSLWSLIPALITSVVIFVRTEKEDFTLQDELEGYKNYTQQVKYRLIPGIW